MSLNIYGYCYGNPVMLRDSSGHIPTLDEAVDMAWDIYGTQIGKQCLGGWKLEDIKTGGDGMVMGAYSKTKDDGTVEYALVSKGTTPTSVSDWQNNVEQLLGTSEDMNASIENAKDFVKDNPNVEITFVGHSKCGAEAAANAVANAVATNKNAILFNPASVYLEGYGLRKSSYTGQMTAYIVKGEALNTVEGWTSEPIGNVVYLPTQYPVNIIISPLNAINAIRNHLMDAVHDAVIEWEGGQ